MSPYIFCVLGLLLVMACSGRAKDRYKPRTEQSECPTMASCNPSYKPLCARNVQGHVRSFNNACVMRVINCKERTDYARIRKGAC